MRPLRRRHDPPAPPSPAWDKLRLDEFARFTTSSPPRPHGGDALAPFMEADRG